jgi:hypothetical protein
MPARKRTAQTLRKEMKGKQRRPRKLIFSWTTPCGTRFVPCLQIRLRQIVSRCQEGSTGAGQTSQSQIPASILAQGLLLPKSLYSHGVPMFAHQQFKNRMAKPFCILRNSRTDKVVLAALLLLSQVAGVSPRAAAQDQSQPPQQTTPPADTNGKPKQDAPAEAGGPSDNIGPYAIPKKNPEAAPPPPPPPINSEKSRGHARLFASR